MTMPFRFAPGCCDPCNPCGRTYSPEQFTVVSGTYDTETHMLSPGGILTVPYSGNNIYALVAIKIENQLESLADVTYLYGNDPIEVNVPANSNIATVTHGTTVCNATLADTNTTAISTKAGPPNGIFPFEFIVFTTPENRILLKHGDDTRDTLTLPESFFDYLPSIKNEGSTEVKVDQIIFYEHLPDLEDAACNLIRRCGGHYQYGSSDPIVFSGSSQFDNVSNTDLTLSGTGFVLNEVSDEYALSRDNCLWDCYYKATIIGKTVTMQAPTYNDRYVVNLSRFAYPADIVWVPFTVPLDGWIKLLPIDETECMLDVFLDSGICVFPSGTTFNDSTVAGWRYNACPAAAGVWKSTPDGGARPFYCWPSQNANLDTTFTSGTDTWKIRINVGGQAILPYSYINFSSGISSPIDIPLSLKSSTYNTSFPLAYQGAVLPNATGSISYQSSNISDWPGLEPCAEGFKYCPYSDGLYNQMGSIDMYFQNKTIAASITGITHVL